MIEDAKDLVEPVEGLLGIMQKIKIDTCDKMPLSVSDANSISVQDSDNPPTTFFHGSLVRKCRTHDVQPLFALIARSTRCPKHPVQSLVHVVVPVAQILSCAVSI